ncbi:hypothetical protein ST398NM01_2812 [Staphylococcus aureus subsp. aureus 71193]|nr:hypothetical protein ST398NM01_2812 [Staphylococcus aureus subsp. aureus 71193]
MANAVEFVVCGAETVTATDNDAIAIYFEILFILSPHD